jgi:RNA polymerase sigma factor (sigma-70 family)
MLLQLNGVGDQKIKYKDHSDIKFDSLNTYLLLAKKAISKFGPKFYNGLSNKMLKDEEAVSSVANAIMMADWRWDENYINDQGTKKTKYSYRNQCALWAIQTYVTKTYKHKKRLSKKTIYSLDHNTDSSDVSIHELINNQNDKCPIEEIIIQEENQNIKNNIQTLLNSDILSDRQKDYINLYFYESYTFEKIGKKYGITREAVRQGLNKALETIRGLVNDQ